MALNHCLFEHRHTADLVIELRSPDEFWEAPQFSGPGALTRAMQMLFVPRLQTHGVVMIPQLQFGEKPGQVPLPSTAPTFARFLHSDSRGPVAQFTLLLNPRHIWSSHIHGARPQRQLQACHRPQGCIARAEADVLRVRHYTELFGHSGRFSCCGTEDKALAWAETHVEGANTDVSMETIDVEAPHNLEGQRVLVQVAQEYFEIFDTSGDSELSEHEVRQAIDLDHFSADQGGHRYRQLLHLRGFHAHGVRLEAGQAVISDMLHRWDMDSSSTLSLTEWHALVVSAALQNHSPPHNQIL